MKKSFGLTALAACVLLSGCSFDFSKLMFWKKDADSQQKEDEGGGNQDTPTPPTPVIEKKITIDALPKTVVGSELDLSKYVKCEGGSGDFAVEVSEAGSEFAGLDLSGKKLMAEHSGEVSFKISYDGISKEATASFVSEEYAKFMADTKDIGYAYGIYGIDDEGYLSSYTNFGENYFYESFENEGMVELDGAVYTFGLDGESLEDVEIFYSLTGNEPETLENYTSSFFLNEDIVKCKYVPAEGKNDAQESLVVEDHDAVAKICEVYFGYSAELVEQYYKLHSVEIYEDALKDSEGNEYPVYDLILNIEVEEDNGETGIYYLGWNLIDVSEEANAVTFLDEMFKTEVPHGADASAFFALIDEAISGHNFEVEYEAGWITYDENGNLVSLGENPFVTPETESLGNYVNHYLMASEIVTAYVTESQTYIENGDAAHSEGIVSHNDQVYFYSGEEHKAELLSTSSSIFDEELRGVTQNYLFLTTDEGDSLFETAFINEVYDDQYGTGFSVGGAAVDELFGNLFYLTIPVETELDDEIEDDYEFILQYADLFNTAAFLYEEDFAKYMSCSVDFFFDGENLEAIYIYFVWEDEDNNGTEFDYVMSAYISNFGTTEIPAEVVVSYPAE